MPSFDAHAAGIEYDGSAPAPPEKEASDLLERWRCVLHLAAAAPASPHDRGGCTRACARAAVERDVELEDRAFVKSDDGTQCGLDAVLSAETSPALDREIYAGVLRFYADCLSGFRKFLFFIQEVR